MINETLQELINNAQPELTANDADESKLTLYTKE